jgi:predicted TIM-barrel fold metal-dependent hydrolase
MSEMKIIDTHEHFWTMKDLPQKMGDQVSGDNRLSIPGMFYTSYIYIEEKGNYET